MKKKAFTYLTIVVCVATIISIIIISYINIQNSKENDDVILSKIIDECTEYMNSLNNVTETNSNEKVVSPNTKIIFKDYYKSCGHIETVDEIASEKIVNMNEEELEKEYADYEIQEFLKEEINLYKEIDGLCDKHYLLIEEEGYLSIYKLQNSGDRFLVAKTNISSEYLTEADNVQLKQGIYVYGQEELNRTLEDFE